MSKKSRTLKKARTPRPPHSVTKVREPADLVSVIPYLLGYEPLESVVIVSLIGPRQQFGPSMRLDLVHLHQVGEFVDYIATMIERQQWRLVLCVAYTDDRELADAVMAPLTVVLKYAGVTVFDSLGVGKGRWWSYTCSNPDCCPEDGTPFDPTASPAAAVMVAEGHSKAISRDALRARLAPMTDDVRSAVGERCRALIAKQASDPSTRWTVAAVEERVVGLLGHDELDVETCADVLAMVQGQMSRDAAWMTMTRSTAAQHFSLWCQVARSAPDRFLAPAASLAGFAAWLSGQGVLASHAADRVSEVAPDYPMMLLVREALDKAINPDVWDTASGKPRRVS